MTDARTKKIGFGKRLLTAAASLVMLATCAVTAMPAHADNTNVAVMGGTTTFNKYLVMDKNANVPNATFTFSIAAGQAVAAKDDMPAIYAGDDSHVTGTPKFDSTAETTVTFGPSDSVYESAQPGDTVVLSETQKYAKKTVTVDFSGVTFSAPGTYRYTITEESNTQQGITDDDDLTRTLDVFVEYVNATNGGALKISKYALHDDESADPTAAKSTGFTNTYATKDLTLTKKVTGNQGDRDKYFEFTVAISGATANTVYSVDLTSAEATTTAGTNQASLTANGSGAVTGTFYLKDGQTIKIQGLTSDTHYTISETSYANDGYKTSFVLDNNPSSEAITTDDQVMGTSAHTVTFTNHKEGTVPTGILLDVAPYIVLVALVGVGLIALFATKKRRSR